MGLLPAVVLDEVVLVTLLLALTRFEVVELLCATVAEVGLRFEVTVRVVVFLIVEGARLPLNEV